ncbi:MAG: sigma 54-interacting transcriptional regulator, partial [bacterium]|nr:sigma 54-interacting transcriptional regulator [bacterium]
MERSSPKITFDNRLLAVEEQFKQRQHKPALAELALLREVDFSSHDYELALYYLLRAEAGFFEGNYKTALDVGLKAAKLLADYPLNKRYARVQLIVSKCYSALGDLKNAEIRARDSLSAYRRASEKLGQVDALNELARISHIRCDYNLAADFLGDALAMIETDQRKKHQFTGNLAMIEIRAGKWEQAERHLAACIDYHTENKQEMSLALNYLSLAYLNLRQRHFIMSGRHLDSALEIISRLGLKREKIIYLEYAGELAFEKGDMFKAKALLSDAYHKGLLLAPNSALVTQSSRRLAEVELELDNIDEAMKFAQKALELSSMLGERLEIGLSNKVIAQVFAAHADLSEATRYIDRAVQVLREVGEPFELARTLTALAEIKGKGATTDLESLVNLHKEALKLFKDLDLEFWMAEENYRIGILSCQKGRLAQGFRRLNRAEKIFAKLNEEAKVRSVGRFLRTLSDQAIALSVSQENHFKAFGNLISPADISELESGQLEDILKVLLKKSHADRALVFAPESAEKELLATFDMSVTQMKRFCEGFEQMMGEEISKRKPSLLLDCRRDPFISNLFPDDAETIASVIVIPFKMSDYGTCFLYLDRLSRDNTLDPFSQADLNFAVGFADLVAFKWTEGLKNRLLADNRRLKSQLQSEAAFPNIITQDHKFLEVLRQVQQVVDSNISISVEGETGCGKDLLSRAIHYNSVRAGKRFVTVNCAALPETLLESELFGFKKGAFTGADRDKPGLFEEADGGTFFLDEIADMPLSIQAKILRVLEANEIVRLGETTPRKVDVRVISATNKDLKTEMSAKRFREDLYYRLSAFSFRLPSLKERRNDIPVLIAHFMEGTSKTIAPDVYQALEKYDWPGNVRELENEIKRL